MTTALYMRNCIAVFLLLLIPCISKGQTQTYYQYKTDEATLVFFDKNLSRYIPHMIRMYQNGKALHEQIWTSDSVYQPEAPLSVLLNPQASHASTLFFTYVSEPQHPTSRLT